MKKMIILCTCLILAILLTSCSTSADAKTGLVQKISVPAPSLENSLFNDKLEQKLTIILPPSYLDNEMLNYPVVYYLHGFGADNNEALKFAKEAKKLMESEECEELVIVSVNGKNKLGGSFYVNSPATGNWRYFVVNDVVSYIDENYRTIKNKDSRGIAGFSMGGFGAINIGLKHPDVFSTVFSISPGLLADGALNNAFTSWDQAFLNAYGAAFSANPSGKHPYAKIPSFSNTPEDNDIILDWENGFGNLASKIEEYQQQENKLNAIQIEYGYNDFYTWIPQGSQSFSALLSLSGVENTIVEFEGGHDNSISTKKNMLPFFSKNLKYNK